MPSRCPCARRVSHRRRSFLYSSVAAALAACLFQAAPVTPQVAKDSAAAGPAAPRSAPVHDSVLEQRVARLELLVAERDAQVEDLQARLDEARQEVVRALAKLQTVASRAEAASAIAEAEIAVQALRAATGTQPGGGADVAQAGTLLQQASGEFAKQNYGGALYLANQTKSLTNASRSRLGGAGRPLGSGRRAQHAIPALALHPVQRRVRAGEQRLGCIAVVGEL